MQKDITDAGGNTGNLTFTLIWKPGVDLDMHFYCEDGEKIYFGNKDCSDGSALLDVDNTGSGTTKVENNYVINKPINNHDYKGYVKYFSGS